MPAGLSWRQMLTVEPVLFLYAYGFFMSVPVSQQYVYYRLSEQKGFPYSFKHNNPGCGSNSLNGSMEKLEKQVQSYASYVQLGIVMFSALPSIVITLFMGGWSDKAGRRPALIVPILGSVLEAAVIIVVVYAKLPIYCLFIGAFIHGLCGYYTTIILACMSYIADTTEQSSIALRLGIIELAVFLGGMVSQATSGLWIENLGFKAPFLFIFGCHMVSMTYAIFFVPESRHRPAEERGKLFSLDNFKSAWRVYSKAPGTKRRNLIILTFCTGILNIPVMGSNSVVNLFTLHSPLCFSPEEVGYFSAFRNVIHGIGGVVTIKVFGMCLSDINVVRISMISYLGFLVFFGFSTTLLMVFLSPLVGIFGGAGPPVFRAMMSKIVSADNQGSLFSATSSVEILFVYIGNLILNSLYPKSLKFDAPGFVFFLAAALMLVPLALTFCLKDHSMFKKKRKMVNQASGYENLTDSEDERGQQNCSPDSSSDIQEDPPIIANV